MRRPSIGLFSSASMMVVVLFAHASMLPGRAHAGLGGPPVASAAADDSFDDPKLARETVPQVFRDTLHGSAGATIAMATIARPAPSRAVAKAPPPVVFAAPVPSSSSSSSSSAPAARAPSVVPSLPPPAASKPHAAAPSSSAPSADPTRGATAPVVPSVVTPVRAVSPALPPKTAAKRLAFADASSTSGGVTRGRAAPSADLSDRHEPTAAPPPQSGQTEGASGRWPYAPRLKLAYRRFAFARIGSSAPSITPGAVLPSSPESFESVSLDFYPISSYMRVGFSTQFGWESGMMDRTGDYFIAESATLGFQLPGRLTPFLEGLAGGGYMRRKQATGDLPSVYWQLGVDAGVEIYLAKRGYVSLAIGYLHPANLFLGQQDLNTIKADTWSLKVGLGI